MEGNALIPEGSTPEYENNRSKFLEFLYLLDGRDAPDHPMHSLYTGLAQSFRERVGHWFVEELVRDWTEAGPEMESLLNELLQKPDAACSPST